MGVRLNLSKAMKMKEDDSWKELSTKFLETKNFGNLDEQEIFDVGKTEDAEILKPTRNQGKPKARWQLIPAHESRLLNA